ncbi:MAG: two pore domain potassium channel family protein [Verrucomicrobiae bacterium]|nr:two pore domain potassium channel family protein [Verrucomicrobiae bacterium]
MIILILTSAGTTDNPSVKLFAGIFYSVVFCVAAYLIGARRRWLIAYLALAIPALPIRISLELFDIPMELALTNAFLSGGLQLMMIYLVFHFSLFEWGASKLDRIFAGICGYLILALFWATLYEVHEILNPGGFASSRDSQVGATDGSLLYFSLVTLSTLGYGDISPITAQTRVLSALEAVTGTLYLAVFVSALVSGLHQRRQPEDTDLTKNFS